MISLQKLINNTPSEVRGRARDVTAVVSGVSLGEKVSGKVKIATIVFTGKGKAATDADWWEFSIELYPTEIHQNIFEKVSASNAAWVKCSCPYFHYKIKHVLWKKDSTSITTKFDRGAMAPPTITNPGGIAYLCKHLYAAQAAVIRRAQDLAKKQQALGKVKFT